jgi:hypothetical protein
MNHKQILIRGFVLILVMLVVAGCAGPTATPYPTTIPQSCPTTASVSCPTAAVKAMPEMNAWRLGWTRDAANVIITFEPGDKCSMEVVHPITGYDWNTLNYEIVVNDQTYQNYLVDAFTVDPGMTPEDILNGPPPASASIPPSYVHLKDVTFVNPMSRTLHAAEITITEGPFYFVCSVQGPDALKIIETLGPLDVPTK